MTINLVIGRQGSGKTLFLIKVAYECYLKGLTVYSNVHLNFPYKKLNYQDIVDCKLKDGIVILDEIHLLLPARRCNSKVSVKICDGFMSMVRKKGLKIYGTTQTERKVDVRIRDEKDFIYICEKFAYVNGEWVKPQDNQNLDVKIPIAVKMDVMDVYSLKWLITGFIGNPYFKLFDSKQIIKVEGLTV